MSTRRDRAKAVARAVAARVDSEPLLGQQRHAEKDVEAGASDGGQRGRKGLGVAAARTAAAAAQSAEDRRKQANDSNTEALYMGVDRRRLMNTPAKGLTAEEASYRIEKFGRNELQEKTESPLSKLITEFRRPMALMVWFAIFIEAVEAILESATYWADVAVLLLLQLVNVFVGWSEELKAGNAVAALKQTLKPEATVKRDGVWCNIPAPEVVVGDRVLIASGSAIPADALLCPGKPIQVDQAALTGESLPKTMYPGEVVKMGSTCTRGEIEALVYATGSETFFGRTALLINAVNDPGNFEKRLRQITLVITCTGVVLVVITFLYLVANQQPILRVTAFCVVLLVASIPIAMRVVCTTTMALGCRSIADEKAIVTRLSAVEDLAGMTILCSDKTGTLTLNEMRLQKEMPMFCEGVSKRDVLVAAALATKWREPPKDALDTLVLNAIDLSPLDMYEQVEQIPFDTALKRTEATIRRKDGSVFRVTKGAPQVLLKMAYNTEDIQGMVDAKVLELAKRGVRSLAVACSNSDDEGWVFMGMLTFLDPARPDSAATIAQAREFGIRTKMITGDHAAIAVEMCHELGMGALVLGPERLPNLNPSDEISEHLGHNYGTVCETADGFAQVLPEHKFVIVETLRQRGHVVAMTGDGVNDAPALKRADVGIAVKGSTDAARAASDVVLTESGLSTIVRAVIISRQIVQRMKNYLIYRIACTVQLLCFFFFSCLFISPSSYHQEMETGEAAWPDFFDLPVMSVVIITILNDGTIISIAYDRVQASRLPEVWNLRAISLVSMIIGVIAMASSMLLLHQCLRSNRINSVMHMFGVPFLSYGEIQMAIFLKISLSNFLSVFAARTTGYCWERIPGTLMTVCVVGALIISTLLAMHWPFADGLTSISALVTIYVWFYVIFWFAVQDVSKVLAYKLLYQMKVMHPVKYIQDLESLFGNATPSLDTHEDPKGRVVSRLRQNNLDSIGDPAWHRL